MVLLNIEQARSVLGYSTPTYTGFRLTQNRNSVIKVGDQIFCELMAEPFKSEKRLPNNRPAVTCILTVCLLQKEGDEVYKDNESIKLIITLKDYNYITNVLKPKIGTRFYIGSIETYNKYVKRKQISNAFFSAEKKFKTEDIKYEDPNTELVANTKKRVVL
jgi:hypothetical protein